MPNLKISVQIKDSALREILFRTGPFQPSTADLQYAGDRFKARIVERTRRGLDYEEKPFAPYSTKGPFYYYPQHRGGEQARIRAVSRLQKKIGGTTTKSRKGIRFESYADFKRSLGRTVVDLTGPSAPHMMQSIVVRVFRNRIQVGIYDSQKALIAEGHNLGISGRLPRRQFLGISRKEEVEIKRDILESMLHLRRPGT